MRQLLSVLLNLLLMGSIHAVAQQFESATEAVKHMGLGWNMGNTLEANNQTVTDPSDPAYWGQQGLESETCWGQIPASPSLMKMMKDAGFGAIRVPVTWYNHMDKDGKVDEAWMKRVHEVVDNVISQGLYCIINVHHDTGATSYSGVTVTHDSWIKADWDNYTANKDRYEYLWNQIATEFKDYDQHLLFESYNEMLDKYSSWCFATFGASSYNEADATSAYQAINAYSQSFVDVVRASGGNNAQRNLIVNTYGSCSGGGSWNSHLKDPLKELKYPEDAAGQGRIIFQVHAYPSLVNTDSKGNITSERTVASIKDEIDDMISAWNSHLVSKGAPVILGEWGTSNVDASVTDYEARPELMRQFCENFVQQCKANGVGTFYWMGITDGAARQFPMFSQPDLARWILQAYHGSSYDPILPVRSDFGNSSISCTVDFHQLWSELNLLQGNITSADYLRLTLELEESPKPGLLQLKAYSTKKPDGTTSAITEATTSATFTASLGTITRITLQCRENSGTVRVRNVYLEKRSGERVPSDPSTYWGCSMRDVTMPSATAITGIRQNMPADGKTCSLSGQVVNNPSRGLFIRNGKKFMK